MSDPEFRTPDGTPVPAVTADEMAAVDRVAVDEFGLEVLQMMENAGRALAWHAREATDGRVLVAAGGGGNGGGGLAAARHLDNRGVPVEVVLDRAPEDLSGPAAHQYRTLAEMGVRTHVGPARLREGDGRSLVVDAVIGYGLDGDVRGAARSLVVATDAREGLVLSLDVPSGRDATSGDALGVAVRPDHTLTLALPKAGLAGLEGALTLADVAIPGGVYRRLDVDYRDPFGERDWVRLDR